MRGDVKTPSAGRGPPDDAGALEAERGQRLVHAGLAAVLVVDRVEGGLAADGLYSDPVTAAIRRAVSAAASERYTPRGLEGSFDKQAPH